ncbi:hypothetical protein [Sciscionella sediminilitoris]|uniref:hypothetical protein n=1 Tax=Sciscionella sediminilitoris TaxID=1445613 RepID=UPI0005650CC8|nr:hypothetical protein [Sciscionella sp. SE31]
MSTPGKSSDPRTTETEQFRKEVSGGLAADEEQVPEGAAGHGSGKLPGPVPGRPRRDGGFLRRLFDRRREHRHTDSRSGGREAGRGEE